MGLLDGGAQLPPLRDQRGGGTSAGSPGRHGHRPRSVRAAAGACTPGGAAAAARGPGQPLRRRSHPEPRLGGLGSLLGDRHVPGQQHQPGAAGFCPGLGCCRSSCPAPPRSYRARSVLRCGGAGQGAGGASAAWAGDPAVPAAPGAAAAGGASHPLAADAGPVSGSDHPLVRRGDSGQWHCLPQPLHRLQQPGALHLGALQPPGAALVLSPLAGGAVAPLVAVPAGGSGPSAFLAPAELAWSCWTRRFALAGADLACADRGVLLHRRHQAAGLHPAGTARWRSAGGAAVRSLPCRRRADRGDAGAGTALERRDQCLPSGRRGPGCRPGPRLDRRRSLLPPVRRGDPGLAPAAAAGAATGAGCSRPHHCAAAPEAEGAARRPDLAVAPQCRCLCGRSRSGGSRPHSVAGSGAVAADPLPGAAGGA